MNTKLNTLILILLFSLLFQISCKEAREQSNNIIKHIELEEDADYIRLSLLDSIPKTEIAFDKKLIDFGDVPNDTLLSGLFLFQNTGNHPLVIAYVHPDCTCTNHSLEKDTVLPGETSWVILELNTLGKFGNQVIFANVACNSPERFHLISLKCNVVD